jgi:hypothetical protein
MPFSIATSFGAGVKFRHFAKQTPNKQRNAYTSAFAFAALRKAALTLLVDGTWAAPEWSSVGRKSRAARERPLLCSIVVRDSKKPWHPLPAYFACLFVAWRRSQRGNLKELGRVPRL